MRVGGEEWERDDGEGEKNGRGVRGIGVEGRVLDG